MKVVKIIVVILLLLIAAVVIVGLVAPKEYEISRTVTIDAPAEVVRKQITHLKEMNKNWSPWADLDPDMKNTYEGEDGTVGAIARWDGNEDVGKGFQEITKVTDTGMETKITFIEPWEGVNFGYTKMEETEEGIKVEWGFKGENPFPMNVFALLMNMEGMLEKDFDKGLNKLKNYCEARAEEMPAAYRGYEVKEMDFPAKTYFTYKDTVKFEEMKGFFQKHLPAIFQASGEAGYQSAGAPSAIYYDWDEENSQAIMAAAIPVEADENASLEGYDKVSVDGKALHIAYHGAYEDVGEAHYAMDDYMKAKGLKLNEVVLEEYVTDPTQEPDTSKWLTNIYYMVQ